MCLLMVYSIVLKNHIVSGHLQFSLKNLWGFCSDDFTPQLFNLITQMQTLIHVNFEDGF